MDARIHNARVVLTIGSIMTAGLQLIIKHGFVGPAPYRCGTISRRLRSHKTHRKY